MKTERSSQLEFPENYSGSTDLGASSIRVYEALEIVELCRYLEEGDEVAIAHVKKLLEGQLPRAGERETQDAIDSGVRVLTNTFSIASTEGYKVRMGTEDDRIVLSDPQRAIVPNKGELKNSHNELSGIVLRAIKSGRSVVGEIGVVLRRGRLDKDIQFYRIPGLSWQNEKGARLLLNDDIFNWALDVKLGGTRTKYFFEVEKSYAGRS